MVEKAREDLWGDPTDVEEGSVGLPGTLPLPLVGGSWALWGAFRCFLYAFGWARTEWVAMAVESGRPW